MWTISMKILEITRMTKQFWIDVEPESDEMDIKLSTALDICYEIYLWTLDTVAEIWINEKQVPRVGNLSKQLTQKIRDNARYREVQRYTLNKVIEAGITQFNQELGIEDDGRVVFPTPIKRDDYQTFTIPARGIWKKYLEDFSRISTAYGLLFVQGEWIEVLKNQAKNKKISMDYMPYLWHSVTIKKQGGMWQIHFNLHEVESHRGKVAQKKMKRERFKAL
jgi:hypothetical protein